MLANFYTKPLQGALFRKFRDVIMGLLHIDTLKMPTTPTNQERVVNNVIMESNESNTDQIDESVSSVGNKLAVCMMDPKVGDVSTSKIQDDTTAGHHATTASCDVGKTKIHEDIDRHDVLGNSSVHRKSYVAIVMS